MKENCFITVLENKLRNIKKKIQDTWKNENNRLNNVLSVYFLPVEETLRAFIKTNLDFADQGKRRSQRLNSKSIQETGLS